MSALDRIGELRATSSPKEKAAILLSSRSLSYFDELLQCARGYDPDVLSPDRLLQWVEWEGLENPFDSIWAMKSDAWKLNVCGVPLACPDTFDPTTLLARWLTRPCWSIMDLWENSDFYKSEEGRPYRGALIECLEAVDVKFKNRTTQNLTYWEHQTRMAAKASSDFDEVQNGRVFVNQPTPHQVAYAVGNSCINSLNLRSVTHAAHDVYIFSRYALGHYTFDSPEALEFRKHWHDDWTWHLLHDILS